ncbi:MAG TPA: signal peptidase I [Oscillospiraceae bacterium]|nr:signal peptidase I [Oscillospiraceae bacterium]
MSGQKYLPTRITYRRGIILISLLVSIYLLENSTITAYMSSFTFTYVLKPALWLCAAFLVWYFPRVRFKTKLRHRSLLYFWSFNFAVIYIIINIIAGLIGGLGKSPYNHSPKGIIINIIFVGSALLGEELIRNYLVHSFTKEENYVAFVFIALLITLAGFPVNRYLRLQNIRDVVKFAAEHFVPEFAHNIFATYLVYLGGPLASIIYFGIIKGFHWLSPVLSNLGWLTVALTDILCPVFFLMFLQTMYFSIIKRGGESYRNKENPFGWAVVIVVSILLIWFAVGVFPIYPSVIATGSMEPMINPGDVILVRKVLNTGDIKDLEIGDVIQFKQDNILISHRIMNIVPDKEKWLYFETKGDNNSAPDTDPVDPRDIKGIVVYTVPKAGWPTLILKGNR